MNRINTIPTLKVSIFTSKSKNLQTWSIISLMAKVFSFLTHDFQKITKLQVDIPTFLMTQYVWTNYSLPFNIRRRWPTPPLDIDLGARRWGSRRPGSRSTNRFFAIFGRTDFRIDVSGAKFQEKIYFDA